MARAQRHKTLLSSMTGNCFGQGGFRQVSEAEEVWHKPVTSRLGASSRIWGKSLADSWPYSGMVRKCEPSYVSSGK